MLKPEEMCRISIVGSKSVMKPAIDALYSSKVLHIDEFNKDQAKELAEKFQLQIGTPLPDAEGLATSLVKMRAIHSHLPQVKGSSAGTQTSEASLKQIAGLENEILSLSEKLKSVEDARAKISANIKDLEVFEGLPVRFEHLADYKSLVVFAGYLSGKADADRIQSAIGTASSKSEAYFWQHAGKNLIIVFAEPAKHEILLRLLSGFGYSELSLASVKAFKGTAAENLHALRIKENELGRAKEHINGELARISRNWMRHLERKEKELSRASEKAQAPMRFATTKSTFIADGWVPCRLYSAMEKQLDSATGGRVHIERYPVSHDAPVELKNPKPVEPFEFFMNLYSLPRYTEIDPTFFMFLTFPLFFGMMLGDIGYGIVTLALFMFLKTKFAAKEMKSLLNVMIFASVSTIIFGFVFGEFFGEEELFGYALPHLISRVHGVNEMLMITSAMGVVHINIGFVVGFINKLHHGFMHALFEKGAWIILEIGLVLMAASFLNIIALSPIIGGLIAIAAIAMLFKGEGIRGIVEIPTLLSNSLSYARIMAVGLASASLAIVVNEIAGEMFHSGGIMVLFGVFVLLAGHSINLALGILGPFLHSLRLHYVEFFTKFFEGGGKRYEPFGR